VCVCPTQCHTKPPHLELRPVTGEQRQHTEPGRGCPGRGGGGGIYRHHLINEQESWAGLQMNEGVCTSFDVMGRKRGPAGRPGAAPNGSHFLYQLIKHPYLHPSLDPDPNNGSRRGEMQATSCLLQMFLSKKPDGDNIVMTALANCC